MGVLVVKVILWLGSLNLLRQASCLSLRDNKTAIPPKPKHVSHAKQAPRPKLTKQALQPQQESQAHVSRACDANVQDGQRQLLFLLCPPFHGSTALQGALMSSKKMSTLCSNGDWACEGNNIMAANGYGRMSVTNWDFEKMLDLYGKVWDLQRPVFFEKNPIQMKEFEKADAGVRNAALPRSLKDVGIKKLGLMYIIMWRPYCLSRMSSNFVQDKDDKVKQKREIIYLRQQMKAHKYLVEMGTPVMVVNFADLIWYPDYTKDRLKKFLPCLGKIDIDFVPELDKDIFEGNAWKAQGTPREYGAAQDPRKCCSYDLKTSTCDESSLPTEDLVKYANYSSYLAFHS